MCAHLLCAVQRTTFAGLDSAGKLLAFSYLNDDKLPSLVENLFDIFRHIDDSFCWNNIVVAVYVSIVHLAKVERILLFFELVKILNVCSVLYDTFPSYRCDWTWI